MRVFASPKHRLHDPDRELESSAFQAPFENPHRAEVIRAALDADGTFDVSEPGEWGTAPIAAVHDAGLVRFLASAWAEYQLEQGPTHDVVPDVFAMSRLREGMGDGPSDPARSRRSSVGGATRRRLRSPKAPTRRHAPLSTWP